MSSESDDRVSDHGAQIVDSIEPIEDVERQYVGSSGDDHANMGAQRPAQERQGAVQREQISDNSDMDETNDHGQRSRSLDGRAALQPGRGQDVHGGIKHDGLTTRDTMAVSSGRLPPSYQKPVGVDSEYSADDTDSAESTQSQVHDDSLRRDPAAKAQSCPRKRRTPMDGPESQAMDGSTEFHTTKKTRKGLNRAYLDLLNQDIKHAAARSIAPAAHDMMDERINLPLSQIGLSVWTSEEKEMFFEALGRLGRDNTVEIAKRIHTKGAMEVRQYMTLLQDALTHRRQQNELDPLSLDNYPAALEISQECCQALDEVADSIARRQERAAMTAEENEDGSDWLLSQENRRELDNEAGDDESKATGVFRTKEWLALSERFFMNAPAPEGNWQSVDGDTPSLWLTALDDFHSLALTLTRRLVAASCYMATTRIRAERGYRSQTQDVVKEKDVHAAAMSLGMAAKKPPLTGCVRRLGILVFETAPMPDKDSALGSISVSDVEDALDIDGPQSASHLRYQVGRMTLSSGDSSSSFESPAASEAESEAEDGGSSSPDDADGEAEGEVEAEANEALLYSAVDAPQTKRGRQALHRRIKAERALERYADAVDMQASYQEELQMWNVLGQPPPDTLVNPGPPPPGRKMKLAVESGYTVGKNWRLHTKVTSEWERQYINT